MGIESLREAEMGIYEVSQFDACDYITTPLAEGIAGLVGAIAFKISDEFVGRFSGLELILWNGVKVSDGCVDATEPQ